MSSSDTVAAINPPQGWTNEEARLARGFYWTDTPNSLKGVLRTHYSLFEAEPIWAREREFGSAQFIFHAKTIHKEKRFYHWNGLEDTVAQFEETSLQQIKEDIDTHGEGKGYVVKLKFMDLEGDPEE